ncbi:enoyl-CoA hydratase/isomerase-like protein [Prauserella rugosa]|uniref:Enoyl-CoA hydratase/isomerase-like protein n=1 Tax=Prauserella rugosa TaxID=43354 RepID=A0A660CMT9_9PSEU|nr:enoyl-CoA hydratase/isomerase-like protein [Prauserella rugosa]
MSVTTTRIDDHVAVVTVDAPPVNALTVAGWFELADAVRGAGADPGVHVVVLRAEGRGFNAGVDIKEIQAASGYEALVGANRGCYAAFAAVYDCAVPVVAAVHGHCLGGASAWPATPTWWWPPTTRRSVCPRSNAERSARRRTWLAWFRRT